MINEVDVDGVGKLDFPEFLSLMARKMKETNTEEELLESLKVFDKNGDGYVSLRELKYLITQMGEKMSEDEIEAMCKVGKIINSKHATYLIECI